MDFVFSSSAFIISHLTRQHIYSSKWSVIQLDCKYSPIFYKVIGTLPKRKKKMLAIEYRHLSSFLTNIGTFCRTSTTESIPHSVQTWCLNAVLCLYPPPPPPAQLSEHWYLYNVQAIVYEWQNVTKRSQRYLNPMNQLQPVPNSHYSYNRRQNELRPFAQK